MSTIPNDRWQPFEISDEFFDRTTIWMLICPKRLNPVQIDFPSLTLVYSHSIIFSQPIVAMID